MSQSLARALGFADGNSLRESIQGAILNTSERGDGNGMERFTSPAQGRADNSDVSQTHQNAAVDVGAQDDSAETPPVVGDQRPAGGRPPRDRLVAMAMSILMSPQGTGWALTALRG